MTHEINFLKPLKGNATKSFIYDPEKLEWTLQEGYKAGKFFDGFTFPVENIRDAFDIIARHHEYPVFMIQGGFMPGIHLRNIVRRIRSDRDDHQPTLTDRPLSLICFDVDGYPCDKFGLPAIDIFIQELPSPFWEADYIYQFSASHGLFDDKTLKCHLFFWLSEPLLNTVIREWVIEYNEEKKWKNILDPAVFVATQPVYTQRRICIGAPDPVQDFLGIVEKSGDLDWTPAPAQESIPTSRKRTPEKKVVEYSLSEGVKKILTGSNFHDEINKLALSLMGKGLAAAEITETIKGLMLAAKENISERTRLQDWQTRFNDIERSVKSAFNLVDNPNQADLVAWLKAAPEARVLKEFPGKTFKKTPAELKEIVDAVAKRTGLDKRELKKRVKGFAEIAENEGRKKGRADLMRDRARRNIFEVVVNDHNAVEASEQIAGILRKSRRWPPVFVSGPALAYIEFDKFITIRQMAKQTAAKNRGERVCRIPVIRPFQKPFHDLIGRLGMDIRFIRQKLGKEIQCPEKLSSVVALGNSRENRELTGIVNCPFVQADWSIFQKNGYDPSTGLYSIIENKLPHERWDTFEAYSFLKDEVLAEFPFNKERDAAVTIAAMMALMQRPLLAQDPAGMPGFGIIAPVQSSGKTALVDIVTSAVLKTTVPASSFSKDNDEEMGKHILALLREGHSCVLFDNITQGTEIKSDELAKAMSSDIYSNRLLGVNRTLRVPSSAIWFFTGNNIYFSGDFSTRVFPVHLNPRMENPETRNFKRQDILDWTLHNRSRILNALISIIQDGRDYGPLDTGSRFKIWDKYIRLPLHKASGGIDVNAAIASNKEHDKDFMNKKKLMEALYNHYGETAFVSRDVIPAGFPSGTSNPPNPLGEKLEEILGKYFESPKSVGKLLGKMVGRVYGNVIMSRVDTDRAWWQIEKIADE